MNSASFYYDFLGIRLPSDSSNGSNRSQDISQNDHKCSQLSLSLISDISEEYLENATLHAGSDERSIGRNSFGEVSGEGIHSYFEYVQKAEDEAVVVLWSKLRNRIKVSNPYLNKAQDIRDLLNMHSNYIQLEGFRALDLSGTGIRVIPREIQYFTKLETLALNNNHISMIPEFICELPIRRLSLENNEISRLPDSFDQMNELYMLDLVGNPIFENSDQRLINFLLGKI